jgi:hypothetical protein
MVGLGIVMVKLSDIPANKERTILVFESSYTL